MTIDDFVRHRWADAKASLRRLDPDFVSIRETRLNLERIELWAPPDMVAKSESQPTKRLPRHWHKLLEACFEMTVMTRNYQVCCRNLTSDAARGLDDVEAGKLFVYNYYMWTFCQDAIVEHTKTVISHVSRVYEVRKGTPNQLKRLYHRKADALKKTEKGRNAVVHGGGFISRALTEDQWWEDSVSVGTLPNYLLDEHHYAERGRSMHAGRYDEIMKVGPQGFLDEVAGILHALEQEVIG